MLGRGRFDSLSERMMSNPAIQSCNWPAHAAGSWLCICVVTEDRSRQDERFACAEEHRLLIVADRLRACSLACRFIVCRALSVELWRELLLGACATTWVVRHDRRPGSSTWRPGWRPRLTRRSGWPGAGRESIHRVAPVRCSASANWVRFRRLALRTRPPEQEISLASDDRPRRRLVAWPGGRCKRSTEPPAV